MQVVTSDFVKDKKILLRYDIDVPTEAGRVVEDFKLKAGIPTLKLCLENASKVILIGHLGRPDGKVVEKLKVGPIVEWFKSNGFSQEIESGKLQILENLRFDPREEAGDLRYGKELSIMGDVYINEAFSSYRPAVSTTILPTLLPHATGLRFAQEVRKLGEVRDNPKKPFIAIMGGAKVEDKLPVIQVLAQKADVVLVGGKIAQQLTKNPTAVGKNILVGKLNNEGTDIAPETTESWRSLIMRAKMIIWNGPLGKFEDPKNDQTKKVAEIVVESGAETVAGGGDTISALNQAQLLNKFSFVSVGGGAMLKFLSDGTLPTIKVLDKPFQV